MIGLGCMRLSTEPAARERAAAVLDAAFAAGIALFDTADAYGLGDTDTGHNETALAAAIQRAGHRPELVTKGGLLRTGGAWIPHGRGKHLAAAARASRDRLGAIDLYLLHAVDPKVPLATSVRALAQLQREGIVRAIGLANCNLTQLEAALAIAPIAAIEIELHPWKLDAIRSGLVAACRERGIRVLAYRPLGGPPGVKRAPRDPILAAIAERLGATPHEVILAWLASLGTIPLPGATTLASIASIARANALVLDEAAHTELAARFLEVGTTSSAGGSEIVVVLGMPASGKTTLAAEYAERGHVRLNRDDRGGSLLELAKALDRELAAGTTHLVVDNTYASRASRAPVIEVARRHGARVRCIVVDTALEDAQANAVARILALHGRLLMPEELRGPGVLAPRAQFRWRREYEAPRADEGWDAIEHVVPERRASGSVPATIVELDGLIWRGRPTRPDEIELLPAASRLPTDRLLAGTTWQPGRTVDEVAALAGALRTRLPIELLACTHPAGPPICWCRKPLPGLALEFAHRHAVDLAASEHWGHTPADRGFARRAGLRYVNLVD